MDRMMQYLDQKGKSKQKHKGVMVFYGLQAPFYFLNQKDRKYKGILSYFTVML